MAPPKLDLDKEPEEEMPAWADLAPPRYDLIRAGVRYSGLPTSILLGLLRDRTTDVKAILAAIGPALFFGRSDGPFVAYDSSVKDQNEDRLIRDRDPPWCWGDALWVTARWQGMPVALYLEKTSDEGGGVGDLYCAVGTGRVSDMDMVEAVVHRAREAGAGAFMVRVRVDLFRESIADR